ncbi:MAG TPA: methylmalonyl-CoA mutase [Desulfotomaculum sp.]|nr:methylmalonyl-CoA mutase [Desulfotomaculum sp.]
MEKRIKVLMAKPGLDGHDRGAKVMALGTRDEGMEEIYTRLRQAPEKIVEAAIQEDVNVIGLSCLSGAHKYLFPEVTRLLKERGVDDVLVLGGGIIPVEDISFLKDNGINEVFGPGTPVKKIAEHIRQNVIH